jgi:hypothetical protein
MSGKSKPVKQIEKTATDVLFSGPMGRSMAVMLGVKPSQRDAFCAAFEVMPLHQAHVYICLAYEASRHGPPAELLKELIDRYEGITERVLPPWPKVKKNSADYVAQAKDALKTGDPDRVAYVLHEFKGFAYAIFCQALIEEYDRIKEGKHAESNDGHDVEHDRPAVCQAAAGGSGRARSDRGTHQKGGRPRNHSAGAPGRKRGHTKGEGPASRGVHEPDAGHD